MMSQKNSFFRLIIRKRLLSSSSTIIHSGNTNNTNAIITKKKACGSCNKSNTAGGEISNPSSQRSSWDGALKQPISIKNKIEDENEAKKSQKTILHDRFGRMHNYLRISLTERCNLRCEYCMPPEGVKLSANSDLLTSEEIVHIARTFVENGVDKIRLTGGEPLVRPDILDVCSRIGSLPGLKTLALTTNGILLEKKLPALVDAGLTNVNISLDTLVAPKFELITRRRGHERVVNAINASLEYAKKGKLQVKVNCVVKRGMNEDELLAFVEWTRHIPELQVRFIEYMPFDANGWSTKNVISYIEMVSRIRERYPGFGRDKVSDGSNPTSKTWRVPGFAGSVGFITAMSDEFCGTCNRIRLTANGNLKACLFGSEEIALRDILRAGGSVESAISTAILRKNEKLGGHADPESIANGINRPMILIGG